jgi:hypothetical protein
LVLVTFNDKAVMQFFGVAVLFNALAPTFPEPQLKQYCHPKELHHRLIIESN